MGWANRAFPEAELEETSVLAMARRIAQVPPDIVQINKRTVHRAMDIMGLRASIRSGTELCALGIHQESFQAFLEQMPDEGADRRALRSATSRSATTGRPDDLLTPFLTSRATMEP